jgi:hypothetical protein
MGINMKVLIACEFSGRVRSEFAKLGHDVTSCDLRDTEIPGKHIIGDVTPLLSASWDLLIAHPPCTYLANSGVRWLYNSDGSIDTERWQDMIKAAEFFKLFLKTDIPHVCIENPIMHKYAAEIIKIGYTQKIQPYEYGHAESKSTCLWLKNLPELKPTNIVCNKYNAKHVVHHMAPGEEREKNRSRTYEGIAKAFASQWGNIV